MSKRSNRIATIGVLSALALGTFNAVPAYAKGTKITKVTKAGACSARSHWKLKVGPDNNVYETEFEVDSNHVGQKWNVVMTDNGVRVFTGARLTKAPSGSFSVARRVANRAGVDHIVASAKNPKTGETCVGRASI